MLVVESVRTASAVLNEVRRADGTVGCVPTMGALHNGHLSLMQHSVDECDFTAVSNFVNPLQFGPDEDFDEYPRDLATDNQLCEQAGVDLVFAPPPREMFAEPATITMQLGGLGDKLEGRHRPGHLEGAAVIVAKLLSIVGPCRAYFGEKDWQQLCVMRTLARDLSLPVKVVGCETVREADGLALSSRNAYLNAEQREGARVLHRALRRGAELLREAAAGELDEQSGQSIQSTIESVCQAMAEMITAEPEVDSLDYAVVADAEKLNPPQELKGHLRLLTAAKFGQARLLDNIGITL